MLKYYWQIYYKDKQKANKADYFLKSRLFPDSVLYKWRYIISVLNNSIYIMTAFALPTKLIRKIKPYDNMLP
jgi:hypothetical protein